MVAKVHSKLCIPILHAMLASTRSFEKNMPALRAESAKYPQVSTTCRSYSDKQAGPIHSILWLPSFLRSLLHTGVTPLHPLPRICDHQRDNDVGKGPGDLLSE